MDSERPLGDPVFEVLWRRVLDEWDDDGAHGALLEHAAAAGRLADAATRYRGMAGDHARGQRAQRQLGAITALAFAQIDASKSPPPRASRAALVAALIVTAALLVTIALYLR